MTTAEQDEPSEITVSDIAPDLERVLEASYAACRRDFDRQLTLERVLVQLLENASIQAILNDCMPGCRIVSLRDKLGAIVAEQLAVEARARRWPTGVHARLIALLGRCLPIGNASVDAFVGRSVFAREQVHEAIWKATVIATGMARPVDTGMLLLAIVRYRFGLAAHALQEHGLDPYGLARRIAYGAGMGAGGQRDTVDPVSDVARLVMLNDDYTPMAVVVELLESVLGMSYREAQEVMMQIHQQGEADCGIFPLAMARAKARDIEAFAGDRCQPLRVRLAMPRPACD